MLGRWFVVYEHNLHAYLGFQSNVLNWEEADADEQPTVYPVHTVNRNTVSDDYRPGDIPHRLEANIRLLRDRSGH